MTDLGRRLNKISVRHMHRKKAKSWEEDLKQIMDEMACELFIRIFYPDFFRRFPNVG